MPVPTYLYHATSNLHAATIAIGGLEARSVGRAAEAYLCMSGTEAGARTLQGKASDIIFRVKGSSLDVASWSQRGAGQNEWRSTEGIAAASLEYRRNLGTATQTTWRSASVYPLGV